MSEKEFENKVKTFLKNKGCWYVKYWGGSVFTKAGIPDLLCCINGHFVALEIKAEDGRVSDLQKHEMFKIEVAGGYAYVVRPSQFESLKSFVEQLLE